MAIQHESVHIDDALELPPTVGSHAATWNASNFPEVGDVLENCRLIAVLGYGSSGRAFLARQPALADRCIVLKVSKNVTEEHLNLARLQHTHIMPLYWASTHPHNGLRVLAMPYLAKTTLAGLLARLASAPIECWDGQRVFAELHNDQDELPVRIPPQEHSAQILKHSSWVDFVLRLGRTLAEALAFAHQRRVLHLDVKPSNILITPDGQPILLDMDVARQPVAAGAETVRWLGGTPAYMSPEQRQAMEALTHHKPIPLQIDERSDVYSLGMVLYLALGGALDRNQRPDPRRLSAMNPRVSRELAEIVARCLAYDPCDRYPNCAALADDLDRQLHDLPLCGVRSRLSERWRKWRRRRPLGLPLVILLASFCAAMSYAGFSYQQINVERRAQAEIALTEGQELQRQGHYEAAVRRFRAGKEIAADATNADFLLEQLSRRHKSAERLQHAQELNQTVRLMRFYSLDERTPRRMQYILEAAGRKVWTNRALLADRSAGTLEQAIEQNIENQLQELMLLWCDLQIRLAPPTHEALVRAEVHKVIAQAEQQFGLSFSVKLAQAQHGLATPKNVLGAKAGWEFCALGRIALTRGDLEHASMNFQKAFELDPLDPVANFYVGVAALRQKRYADALHALSFCLGADPVPECFVLRGEAHAALGHHDQGLRDFQLAIDRRPDFAHAYQLRGNLYQATGRMKEAQEDLECARKLREWPKSR